MHPAQIKNRVAKTAHMTAWMRTLARLTAGQDLANTDHLAERFLLPHQRWLNRAPHLTRWLTESAYPGGIGYFNARTRYFDDQLQQEAASGLEQLVLLGAGFDSRPIRFAAQLAGTRTFVVDMPQVLRLRAEQLASLYSPGPVVDVPVDFAVDDLGATLLAHGYDASARTLFADDG